MIGSREERERAVAAVRLHGGETAGSSSTLGLAIEELKKTLALAQEGQWPEAQAAAVKAYLDGVEPAEAELRSRDAGFTASLEQSMAEVRGVLQRRAPIADVESKIASADGALRRAEGVLAQGIASPAFTFSVAAGIFLREAFEAVLILITLLGVIRSMGTRSALLAVHAGWMIAVLFGLVTWFFSGWLIAISGAQREMLEAVTSLLAVTVLLYFGFWLHQKSEFGKWHAFIKDKVNSAVEGKKLWALGMISFMAVFREAFETVIFLRALLIEAGPQQQMAMAAGVILSFILVLALAAALVRFSVKIPLRQLFALSSLVMVVLALILVGKAAHSFQETGLLTVTTLPVSLHVDLIGVYPTYETLVPQLAVIAVAFGYWLYSRRFALK
jgi:high-affinity iron transporter